MRFDNRSTEEQLLVALDEWIAKVAGGESSIGAFNKWFMSREWESAMAARSSGLRLGWRIENLLYQWRSFPDRVDGAWILKGVRNLIDEEPSLRPFFPKLLGSDPPSLHREQKNRIEGGRQPIYLGWSYSTVLLGGAGR